MKGSLLVENSKKRFEPSWRSGGPAGAGRGRGLTLEQDQPPGRHFPRYTPWVDRPRAGRSWTFLKNKKQEPVCGWDPLVGTGAIEPGCRGGPARRRTGELPSRPSCCGRRTSTARRLGCSRWAGAGPEENGALVFLLELSQPGGQIARPRFARRGKSGPIFALEGSRRTGAEVRNRYCAGWGARIVSRLTYPIRCAATIR